MTQSPFKAFSRSAQLATNYTLQKHYLAWQCLSLFWVDAGTESLSQEANDGAKSLAVIANDSTLPLSS